MLPVTTWKGEHCISKQMFAMKLLATYWPEPGMGSARPCVSHICDVITALIT